MCFGTSGAGLEPSAPGPITPGIFFHQAIPLQPLESGGHARTVETMTLLCRSASVR